MAPVHLHLTISRTCYVGIIDCKNHKGKFYDVNQRYNIYSQECEDWSDICRDEERKHAHTHTHTDSVKLIGMKIV